MRLSFLASLLSACLAVGCSSSGGNSPEDFAPTSEEALNWATNPMGLRLVYDDVSGHVHATVRSRVLEGEHLVLRVRRGRLAAGEDRLALLDCAQLPVAPPLPEQMYSRVVYDGPEVDRSLLASVYSQEWIDQNITQDMIERLSREGADAIVEACIVGPQNARIRVQTNIQNAWDGTDPNAAPALRAPNRAGSP